MNIRHTSSTTSNFSVAKTKCGEVYHIEPNLIHDARGYFFESFRFDVLSPYIPRPFVQDNISFTKMEHTLRGLHFQTSPHAQAKLVTVLRGEVLDVIVDLRHGSPTYGVWESFVLSSDRKNMLYIPRGFAHGFVTHTPEVLFSYKCDNYFMGSANSGIIWNDPTLAIDWQLKDIPQMNEKDAQLQTFETFKNAHRDEHDQGNAYTVKE